MARREMITDPQDFFDRGCGRCDRFDSAECSTRIWHEGLLALRRICLDAGLEETAKWGHPCYMRGDRNIALIAAFRDDFRMTFMNAALLKDAEGVLEKNGPNTRVAGIMRFTSDDQVGEMEPTIREYLAEAVGYADAGVKPAKDTVEIDLPGELIDALDSDPELAEAFEALTPGRQRSYAINLNSARQSSTRVARIAKFRSRIIAGKGAQEY